MPTPSLVEAGKAAQEVGGAGAATLYWFNVYVINFESLAPAVAAMRRGRDARRQRLRCPIAAWVRLPPLKFDQRPPDGSLFRVTVLDARGTSTGGHHAFQFVNADTQILRRPFPVEKLAVVGVGFRLASGVLSGTLGESLGSHFANIGGGSLGHSHAAISVVLRCFAFSSKAAT